jgi:hypothetical protein
MYLLREKSNFEKSGRRLKGNIETCLREAGCEIIRWIEVAQDTALPHNFLITIFDLQLL